MKKKLCVYCGSKSETHAPFPEKILKGGHWRTIICPKCESLESIRLVDSDSGNPESFKETMVRQDKNQPKRKLVGNGYIDIIFWFDLKNEPIGFQFTMREGEFNEHAFTWSKEKGSNFKRVYTKRRTFLTNTLQGQETFPKEKYITELCKYGYNLKLKFKDIVLKKIKDA